MTKIHSLGFPRIGAQRELKKALEAYWAGQSAQHDLLATGRNLRAAHWRLQADAGVADVPVGDFAWYDHILEWTTLLGAVPARFAHGGGAVDLDTLFRMARGRAPNGPPADACEMTKWFDTNYHYIVPELAPNQDFYIARVSLFEQVAEAQVLGHSVKVVIPGPLTWLWLGKGPLYKHGAADPRKLALLKRLLPVYQAVLAQLAKQNVQWVQIDEPILVLDLPQVWREAFGTVYEQLAEAPVKLLLTTYFGALGENLATAADLPVAGLHVDLVRAPEQLDAVLRALSVEQVLSAGVINGRNIWRTDLDAVLATVQPVRDQLGDRLWVAPSCSLLHVPVNLAQETELDVELKSWLSFATQKLDEVALLATCLDGQADAANQIAWQAQHAALATRRLSTRIHNPAVARRVAGEQTLNRDRHVFAERIVGQQARLGLPAYPTTTIGSFPQTAEIRALRSAWKAGDISDNQYELAIRGEIETVIHFQEEIGLDVLVHGEPERNDMVEYFGELLAGFALTHHGWVQSYGSRCVKPPIIFGDVARTAPMTVAWSAYAQSLTDKPVKGMLTGPVTILQWSFVRDDQPREQTCRQLALVLRDEVIDLEQAGIKVIQLDEPALREGLPLRTKDWQTYLEWAVDAFRLATAGVQDDTQIHTHMCYSEFNDIIGAIAAMDADVITIETSRSNMALLDAFEKFQYPNDIGPGVYDIHSPNVPDVDWIVQLMNRAASRLPKERLWVNPDCGLKTRSWPETQAALESMVEAARLLRSHT